MVDNLVQNHRLIPKLRSNLKELEVALLRLIQRDPRFFSERQHPARQVLEKISTAVWPSRLKLIQSTTVFKPLLRAQSICFAVVTLTQWHLHELSGLG